MIVKCENCQTKFRLREDKVQLKKRVKVRCSKCKEVFIVDLIKLAEQDETSQAASTSPPTAEKLKSPEAPKTVETAGAETESSPPSDKDTEVIPEKVRRRKDAAYSLEDMTLEGSEPEDFPSMGTGELEWDRIVKPKPQMDPELEKTLIMGPPPSPKSAAKEKNVDDFDLRKYFDLDHVTPSGTVKDAGPKVLTDIEPPPTSEEEQPDESQSPILDEAESPKPPPTIKPPPAAKSRPIRKRPQIPPPQPPAKKAPTIILTVILTIFVIGLILLTVIYFNLVPLDKIIGRGVPSVSAPPFTDMKGYYVANAKEGKIFIIEGTYINHKSKTESHVKVRGKLFDSDGNLIAAKENFCGNRLDASTLKTASRTEIETALNIQFGKDGSNVNLAPGAAIPFQIAFFQLPTGLAEFSVENISTK